MSLHISKALTLPAVMGSMEGLPLQPQHDIQLCVGAGTMETKVASKILSMPALEYNSWESLL